jgi:hypothetical protein
MVKCGVLFEVRIEFLNTIQTSFGFEALMKITFFLRRREAEKGILWLSASYPVVFRFKYQPGDQLS